MIKTQSRRATGKTRRGPRLIKATKPRAKINTGIRRYRPGQATIQPPRPPGVPDYNLRFRSVKQYERTVASAGKTIVDGRPLSINRYILAAVDRANDAVLGPAG